MPNITIITTPIKLVTIKVFSKFAIGSFPLGVINNDIFEIMF